MIQAPRSHTRIRIQIIFIIIQWSQQSNIALASDIYKQLTNTNSLDIIDYHIQATYED